MIRKAKSSKTRSTIESPPPGRRPRADRRTSTRTLTEDEADILFAEKHKKAKRYPLRDVIEETGDIDLLDS